jgi:hypothetical protein
MGALINASINVAKLPKEKFVTGKDGAVWYNLTIAINDETRFGNNVAIMDSRTKEEREAGIKPNYLGNGKVVFINDVDGNSGKIFLAEREEKQEDVSVSQSETADLPF